MSRRSRHTSSANKVPAPKPNTSNTPAMVRFILSPPPHQADLVNANTAYKTELRGAPAGANLLKTTPLETSANVLRINRSLVRAFHLLPHTVRQLFNFFSFLDHFQGEHV